MFSELRSRVYRSPLGYGVAFLFALLAVGVSYCVPLLPKIPWTLSFFTVALVAWIEGVLPALRPVLLSTVGIYALVLVPASRSSRDPQSFAQALAFDLTAILIAYLVSRRNRAMAAPSTSDSPILYSQEGPNERGIRTRPRRPHGLGETADIAEESLQKG